MDIYCPKCAEPWEIDTLHDYAEEHGKKFDEVRKAFMTKGCGVAFEAWKIECRATSTGAMFAVLAEIMGDDIDGYASGSEDALWWARNT